MVINVQYHPILHPQRGRERRPLRRRGFLLLRDILHRRHELGADAAQLLRLPSGLVLDRFLTNLEFI